MSNYVPRPQYTEVSRALSEVRRKLEATQLALDAATANETRLLGDTENYEDLIKDFHLLAKTCMDALSGADLKDDQAINFTMSHLSHYLSTGEVKIEGAKKSEDTPRPPEFCLAKGYESEWVDGPYDSEEKARAKIKLYDDEDEIRVHHVKYMGASDWLPSIGDFLETMDMTAYDNGHNFDGPQHVIISEPGAHRALERWAENWITIETEKWVGEEVK